MKKLEGYILLGRVPLTRSIPQHNNKKTNKP